MENNTVKSDHDQNADSDARLLALEERVHQLEIHVAFLLKKWESYGLV